jgi:transformation/transcription domain-associated protein
MQIMKKAAEKAAAEKAANSRQNQPTTDPPRRSNDQPMNGIEATSSDSNTSQTPGIALSAPEVHPSDRPVGNSVVAQGASSDTPVSHRQPWEYVDEVLQVLKTSFPLLILSLETMVDQIQHKFKLSSDEDVYRSICMLLQDAVQVCTRSVDLAKC